MNYRETVEYLYSRLPMFSKNGASAIKPSLANIRELCSRLDNPQQKFKSIHVGGTNGKGSTSHMLAAILQTAGYKTGLYTSPHLRDFRERIRINGAMIPEDMVINFVRDQKTTIEEIEPSFFEVTVAMAFSYFAKEEVDVAVIEVGLGGRLDSTNIISPILSVITNIGYDHMNILGNSLKELAGEKAGIIKPHIPVIIGEKHEEVADVFIKKAAECHSPITFASERWKVSEPASADVTSLSERENPGLLRKLELSRIKNDPPAVLPDELSLDLDLTGTYQLKNVKTVLTAVDQLNNLRLTISASHIQIALKQVTALTGLMGRWQTLRRNPLVIADTGHNEDGIREVLKNISAVSYDRLHMVIGMVKDKDIRKVLTLLPRDAKYYFCSPALERAKPADELKNQAHTLGLTGKSYPSVQDALQAAISQAGANDLVFVGGSTFVVAEVV